MTRLFESLSQKYHDKFYYTEEANGPKRTYIKYCMIMKNIIHDIV